MRTMVKLRIVVSQKLIFDEVDASFAASASRFKYSTSVKKKLVSRGGIHNEAKVLLNSHWKFYASKGLVQLQDEQALLIRFLFQNLKY